MGYIRSAVTAKDKARSLWNKWMPKSALLTKTLIGWHSSERSLPSTVANTIRQSFMFRSHFPVTGRPHHPAIRRQWRRCYRENSGCRSYSTVRTENRHTVIPSLTIRGKWSTRAKTSCRWQNLSHRRKTSPKYRPKQKLKRTELNKTKRNRKRRPKKPSPIPIMYRKHRSIGSRISRSILPTTLTMRPSTDVDGNARAGQIPDDSHQQTIKSDKLCSY